MNNTQYFTDLHAQNDPLMIANVWNAQSATVFTKLGFKALATSSAAVAEALGYRDGEEMSFEEYVFIVKRILASSKLPLSVDLETGFGKSTDEVIANIELLHKIGVAGINIEDSSIQDGTRRIHDAGVFASRLSQIISSLRTKNIRIFINTRCDAFILRMPDARAEAIRRIKIYEPTGVDGIFLPCITDIDDIKAAVQSTRLPLNVLCMPNLPDFKSLKSAGVRRISMGDFVYAYLYKELEHVAGRIMAAGNFSPLF
jgi:2-methylisocitrate lyase-like PEP mutase family enzyme